MAVESIKWRRNAKLKQLIPMKEKGFVRDPN